MADRGGKFSYCRNFFRQFRGGILIFWPDRGGKKHSPWPEKFFWLRRTENFSTGGGKFTPRTYPQLGGANEKNFVWGGQKKILLWHPQYLSTYALGSSPLPKIFYPWDKKFPGMLRHSLSLPMGVNQKKFFTQGSAHPLPPPLPMYVGHKCTVYNNWIFTIWDVVGNTVKLQFCIILKITSSRNFSK